MITRYDLITQYRFDGKRPCEIVKLTNLSLSTVKYWLRKGRENGLIYTRLPHTATNLGVTSTNKQNQFYFKKTMETRDKIIEASKIEREVMEYQKQDPATWETNKPDKNSELFTPSSLDYIFKR